MGRDFVFEVVPGWDFIRKVWRVLEHWRGLLDDLG